jgi:hypothetical protein
MPAGCSGDAGTIVNRREPDDREIQIVQAAFDAIGESGHVEQSLACKVRDIQDFAWDESSLELAPTLAEAVDNFTRSPLVTDLPVSADVALPSLAIQARNAWNVPLLREGDVIGLLILQLETVGFAVSGAMLCV